MRRNQILYPALLVLKDRLLGRDAPEESVRVLIVDDNRAFLEYAKVLLAGRTDALVAGRAFSAHDIARKVEESLCDVVMVDAAACCADGIQITVQLRAKGYDRGIILVTTQTGSEFDERAKSAGADALLVGTESPAAILETIRRVARAKHSCKSLDRSFIDVLDHPPGTVDS